MMTESQSALAILLILIVVAVVWFASRRGPAAAAGVRLREILPPQFVVADIETTGLDPMKHEIIEIAAIRVNRDSDRHDTYTALVKPRRKVTKKITEITGITNDMLERDGAPIDEVMREFLDFVGDLRLVFYNAPFDMAFLSPAAQRISREIPNPVSDALAMAREAWPGLRSYSLTSLAKAGGLETAGAHRALRDCEMTMLAYATAASRLERLG